MARLQEVPVLLETRSTQLEAVVLDARASRPGGAAAVILHPYSLLGGSMQDPVVLELFRCVPACAWVGGWTIAGRMASQGRSAPFPCPPLTSLLTCLPACSAAAASPAFSLVLRYNQRGVGRSSGW